MTVLCLVELDGTDPADASLRALTLARTLGDILSGQWCSRIPPRCPRPRWPATASPTCT